MPSKKSQVFDTLFQSIVDPPAIGVGSDEVEGLVPLNAANIDQVTEELDRGSTESQQEVLRCPLSGRSDGMFDG